MDREEKLKYEEPRMVQKDEEKKTGESGSNANISTTGEESVNSEDISKKTKLPAGELVFNSREMRDILQDKMANYHKAHENDNDEDAEPEAEEEEYKVCKEHEEDDSYKDDNIDEEELVQKLLFQASHLSLPDPNKQNQDNSAGATDNSSKRNSMGSDLSSVPSSVFVASVSSSESSFQSSASRGNSLGDDFEFGGQRLKSASQDSTSSYGSNSSIDNDAPTTSRKSNIPVPEVKKVHEGISEAKLSTAQLRYIATPLIDRPEFAKVDKDAIERERRKATRVGAAGKIYAFTTESAEYIKNDPEFIIPGPNPRRIPHDELMNTFNGFSNMVLAHEISLSEDFRLERYVPPPEGIEARVQTQLKRAYWDLFTEDIEKDPPEYARALSVFGELKKSVLGLLLPHNIKTRDTINEVLDVDHISRQIANDAFTFEDFYKYSRFIIDTLAQLCSPSRDADVNALRDLEKPAEIFAGILDVADLMKLDIANYYIQQFRPSIIKHCAHYERIKFADFLEVERRLGEDGLRATRNWLARHKINRQDTATILAKAFGELLGVNFNYEVPETLTLDIGRYRQVSRKMLRLAVLGAITLTIGAIAQSMMQEASHEFREVLKRNIKILISDEDMVDEKKFNDSIERSAEQCIVIVEEYVESKRNSPLTVEEKENIRQCVNELRNSDNKVRGLVFRRVLDYTEEILISQYKYHVPVPVGLFAVRIEVMTLIGDFSQIVWHNRIVFGELYTAIIENKIGLPTNLNPDQFDPEFQKVIDMLREDDILQRQAESPQSSGVTATS